MLGEIQVLYHFQDCLESELKSIDIVPGTLIFCRDSGNHFYDTLEGRRIPIASKIAILTDAERRAIILPDSDKYYICKDTKIGWIYSNGEWVSIGNKPKLNYMIPITLEKNGTLDLPNSELNEGTSLEFIADGTLKDLVTDASVTLEITANNTIHVTNASAYELYGMIHVYD